MPQLQTQPDTANSNVVALSQHSSAVAEKCAAAEEQPHIPEKPLDFKNPDVQAKVKRSFVRQSYKPEAFKDYKIHKLAQSQGVDDHVRQIHQMLNFHPNGSVLLRTAKGLSFESQDPYLKELALCSLKSVDHAFTIMEFYSEETYFGSGYLRLGSQLLEKSSFSKDGKPYKNVPKYLHLAVRSGTSEFSIPSLLQANPMFIQRKSRNLLAKF